MCRCAQIRRLHFQTLSNTCSHVRCGMRAAVKTKNIFSPALQTSRPTWRRQLRIECGTHPGVRDNLCTHRSCCWCPRRSSVNASITSGARGVSTRAATRRRLRFGFASSWQLRRLSPKRVGLLVEPCSRTCKRRATRSFIDYVASGIMRPNTPQDVPATDGLMLDLVRRHWDFSSEERFALS